MNGEVRAHAKTPSVEKRNELINEALAERDEVTLCALLGAPGYLSGLSKAETAHYTRKYHEITNPLLMQRFEVLNAVRKKVEKSILIFEPEIWKQVGINKIQLEALRTGSKAAADAWIMSEFSESNPN